MRFVYLMALCLVNGIQSKLASVLKEAVLTMLSGTF